ncbi:hypothetical protein Ancab_022716 [Ancistrocladus abbreviatus]
MEGANDLHQSRPEMDTTKQHRSRWPVLRLILRWSYHRPNPSLPLHRQLDEPPLHTHVSIEDGGSPNLEDVSTITRLRSTLFSTVSIRSRGGDDGSDVDDFEARMAKIEADLQKEELENLARIKAHFPSRCNSVSEIEVQRQTNSQFKKKLIDAKLYRCLIDGDVTGFQQAVSGNRLSDFFCPGDNTVLHIAAGAGQEELISFILSENKHLLTFRNSRGDLAFHVAARTGQLQSLISLAHWELHVDNSSSTCHKDEEQKQQEENQVAISKDIMGEVNKEENTALHIALENHQELMAWYLVYKYPEASYCLNAEKISPLYLAIKAGYWEERKGKRRSGYWNLVEYMLQRQPISSEMGNHLLDGKSVVHAAIIARNKEILGAMLDGNSALVDSSDEERRTPLSYAAYIGYLEGVQYFHEKFLDQTFKQERNGYFPIHWACSGGHERVVKHFLEHFPKTSNLFTEKGQNILHIAAWSGTANVVKHLLKLPEAERLLNLKDADGNTPLHLATIGKHPKAVHVLTKDKRVQLGLQNKRGFTPLDAALDYDGKVPSFEERLTWLALTYADAPRAPHPCSIRQNIEPPNLDNYKERINTPPDLDNYKERVNTLLLVATLVATVTFAAGFTLPGGYNQNDPNIGMATLVKKHAFQAFVISNTIAMYSSILVAVTLIWAQLGDLKLILFCLKSALPMLGAALTTMSVAFMVGIYLVVSNHHWLAIVVLVMGCIFLGALLVFFVPLYSPSSIKSQVVRYIFYVPLHLMLLVSERQTDRSTFE